MSVSIYDVAREAGVALGTVSRVLNGAPTVGEATKARVEAAIEKLGYRPSSLARSLARGSTRTLAMLVPDLSNPLFGDTAAGAQDAADVLDHVVLVYGTNDNPERERRYIDSFLDRQIDGLLLVRSILGADELAPIVERVPVIQVGRQHHLPGSRIVHVDQVLGARSAVEHLIELGHRHIALVEGPGTNDAAVERGIGYYQALAATCIDPDPRLVVRGSLDEAGGASATAELLNRRTDVTAIFASTDLMALGAMSVLHGHGVRIPDDISLIGFDDIRISRFFAVPLTTIRQPAHSMGAMAVTMALEGADGQSHVMPTELIIRNSTARI